MNQAQLSFLKKSAKQFGGSLLKGNPKEKRPIALKRPMHLVLKSQHAIGANSMLAKAHVKQIDRIVRKQAVACGVRIYHFVNVGNHLHLVIRLHNRELYRVFIRAISGLIARQVLGKQRGTQGQKTQFWLARPFSRIIMWGADFKGIGQYMQKNQAQAKGVNANASVGTNVKIKRGNSLFSSFGFDSQLSFVDTA